MAEKRKRTFKPRVDLLRSMTAAELQVRFWFNQDGIGFIANLVCDFNGPPTNINYSVPAHVQVMVTLRYFATEECSCAVGTVLASSIHRIIHRMTTALVQPHIVRRFISFPVQPDIIRNRSKSK